VHGAIPNERAGRRESLCHLLVGTYIEDPDKVALIVLVDDADDLSDVHLEFGRKDGNRLSAANALSCALGDQILVFSASGGVLVDDQRSRPLR
jgi:hypothetical protein